jgi:hypothetical protein
MSPRIFPGLSLAAGAPHAAADKRLTATWTLSGKFTHQRAMLLE